MPTFKKIKDKPKDRPKDKPVDLARLGKFKLIDWKKLTEKDITEFDTCGETLLHYCAKASKWQSLPISLRDKKYWTDSKDGNSIYMCAFHGKDPSWINKNELTENEILKKNKYGESLAYIAILTYNLNHIPKASITDKVLRDQTQKQELKGYNGRIIHSIAANNQIKQVPIELLTEDLLSIQGQYGQSVYHLLAQNDQIQLIPKKLLTKNALCIEDFYGVSVLGTIAENQPKFIPKEFLTPEMFYKGKKGETPLHAWAESEHWNSIPDNLLNKESISLKSSPESPSPLDYIIDHYSKDILTLYPNTKTSLVKKMTRLLSLANTKELERLKSQEETKDKERSMKPTVKEHGVLHLINSQLKKNKVLKKLSERTFELQI
jgi:hypothetical protein